MLHLLSKNERTATLMEKCFAAVAYGMASIAIMLLNKIILTQFCFPSFSFIALVQYIATLLVLLVQKYIFGTVQFPPLSKETVKAVFPLPLLFMLNTLSGLGATKALNMPMFVLLRRFSILMTLGLEMHLLGKRFSHLIHVSVFLMLMGAFIAALGDLQMNVPGYVMILANDLFTALQGVVLRRKLDDQERLGSHGLMFYNNLLTLPLLVGLMFSSHEWADIIHYERWVSPVFILGIVCSAFMGFILNYAYFLCTKLNSPLTTTVIGCIKNIATTYLGMLFHDYRFTVVNFLGINVSVAGSLIYSMAEYTKHREAVKTCKEGSPA